MLALYIYIIIPLLIWGQRADRWFCREKGSTKYKSIQESGSKFTTKYKSRESKMAAHYKIEIQDHKKPLKNGCLQNRLKKKLPLPSLENAQNRLDGAHFLYKIMGCCYLSSQCRVTSSTPNFVYKIEAWGGRTKKKCILKDPILPGNDFVEAIFGIVVSCFDGSSLDGLLFCRGGFGCLPCLVLYFVEACRGPMYVHVCRMICAFPHRNISWQQMSKVIWDVVWKLRKAYKK